MARWEPYSDRLKEIRDELEAGEGADIPALRAELDEIAQEVETASGAPVADSVAMRAAILLDGDDPQVSQAADN